MGVLKYFFIYPFVAFLFFIGLSIIFNIIAGDMETSLVLSTSFSLIMAIRVTAYYSQDLSKDLAKMLPFALLGVFLIDPSYFGLESQFELGAMIGRFEQIPTLLTEGTQYILLIVIVEWILRLALKIRYMIIPKKRKTSA